MIFVQSHGDEMAHLYSHALKGGPCIVCDTAVTAIPIPMWNCDIDVVVGV